MKRLLVLGMLGVVLWSSSGCCIIDRCFHCPCGRWRGGGCGFGGCGGCGSCGGGACGDCGGYGACSSCPGCDDGCCPYGSGGGGPVYEDGGVYDDGGGQYYGANPGRVGCANCGYAARTSGSGYAAVQGPPGPPVGQVAYPYYTTRGPRDFLARNPPDIGP